MVNQAFRIKIAYLRNYGGYMRRLRRLYEKEKKIPEIGRYLMGPTKSTLYISYHIILYPDQEIILLHPFVCYKKHKRKKDKRGN